MPSCAIRWSSAADSAYNTLSFASSSSVVPEFLFDRRKEMRLSTNPRSSSLRIDNSVSTRSRMVIHYFVLFIDRIQFRVCREELQDCGDVGVEVDGFDAVVDFASCHSTIK